MFNSNTIKKLSKTSFFTLLMAGTLLAQSGTAATFKFSDFAFSRASSSPTNEFHNKTFYQTQKTTTNNQGRSTTVTTDVKGVAAFQQFVQNESSAIDLNTLKARKLDPTKLKLKNDRKINIYFIDEGAGYRNQLKLVTANGTNKTGLVFYDGSKGGGANELQAGDYVSVGNNLSNSDVVKAGTILDFQLRANGFDTNNNTSRANADVWYADKSKNVDGLQHVIAYEYQGFLVLAWEDVNGGGDKDYNDIVFAVDIGQANLDAIPNEPPANQPPNAKNDNSSTAYNTPVSIDVLANDTDPENQALTITSATSLTGATVQVVNNKVQYTPKSDFNIAGGSDAFSYTIKDTEGATSSAIVTVNVGAKPTPPPVPKQNQAPMALNDLASTLNNTPVIIDVLANDIDPEGQALTITNINSATGATVEKTADGKVKYTPKSNSSKRAGISDTFTYTIKDPQGATSSATVTVNVGEQPNQPPKAEDDEVSTSHKTPVIVNVLANDSDPDGDPITLDSVNSSPGSTTRITTDGKVEYTPSSSNKAARNDSFTYTIKDSDGAIGSATVTVSVGAKPNEKPVAVDDQMSTAYGAPVTVDVLANDSDPDDQTITIKDVKSDTGATVEVIDGKVRYTPKADFNKAGGTDSFTYIIEDVQGATDSATVTITVGKKPNGAPNAVDDTTSTAYGTPVTVDVLANDSDPEGDMITIQNVQSDTGATVQMVSGQVVYTPKSDFNTAGGSDSFTYTIQDSEGHQSSATVTVTVDMKPVSIPAPDGGNNPGGGTPTPYSD